MRTFVIVVLLLLGAMAYFTHLNPDPVTFRLSETREGQLPLPVLVLGAIATGGALVLFGLGMREMRRWWANWRLGRQRQAAGKAQEHLTEARQELFSGRVREAVSHLSRVLEINPNQTSALIQLGAIKQQAGELDEAIRCYRRARVADDQNVEVSLSLARAFESSGRNDEAEQVYRDVLKFDESNPAALAGLRDLLMRAERWEEAHGLQEQIIKAAKSPSETNTARRLFCGIKYEIGRMWMDRGDTDRARRAFRGAVKLDQRFVPAYIGWGELIAQEGRLRDAAALYEKAYESVPDIIFLHRMEDLYVEMGEPEQVLRCYHDAARKDPDSHALRFYLGKAYYRLEMLDDALEVLSAIDASDERFPDLHRLLGNLAERRGDHMRALEEFKRALGLKKRVVVPYYCPNCDYHASKYFGRCPRCHLWNTLSAMPILVKQNPLDVAVRASW